MQHDTGGSCSGKAQIQTDVYKIRPGLKPRHSHLQATANRIPNRNNTNPNSNCNLIHNPWPEFRRGPSIYARENYYSRQS